MGLKAEAASPSVVYRVLAVRTGGGIWVGLRSRAQRPDGGGLLCCRARTFVRRAPLARGTRDVRVRVPLIFTIGRVFRYRVS